MILSRCCLKCRSYQKRFKEAPSRTHSNAIYRMSSAFSLPPPFKKGKTHINKTKQQNSRRAITIPHESSILSIYRQKAPCVEFIGYGWRNFSCVCIVNMLQSSKSKAHYQTSSTSTASLTQLSIYNALLAYNMQLCCCCGFFYTWIFQSNQSLFSTFDKTCEKQNQDIFCEQGKCLVFRSP